jgi:hypothetical protein
MSTSEKIPPGEQPVSQPPKLLDRLRELLRRRRWTVGQIEVGVRWVAKFIHFHGLRHPRAGA